MAKNDEKNETDPQAPEAPSEAATDQTEATDGEQTADEVTKFLSAADEFADAKAKYEKLSADLKAKIKDENKTVALDLVQGVSNSIVPDLIFAVGRRGQVLKNFTIRYDSKRESNERVKIVTSAVRMSGADFETFKMENKTRLAEVEAVEASAEKESAEAAAATSDSD